MEQRQVVHDTGSSGVRAVERGFLILSAFTDQKGELTLEALSETIGLPKSTTHRILSTLIKSSFIERGRHAGAYRLGIGAAIVGRIALASRSPGEAVHPLLASLAEETSETATLSIGQGKRVLAVDAVFSHQPLRYELDMGTPSPAHCTAAGKVLLARLTDPEVAKLFATDSLTSFTPRTIPNVGALLQEIEVVRREEYAVDNEEYASGLRCIAVPVRDKTGHTEFALSVSGPAARVTSTQALGFLPVMIRIATDIGPLL